MDYVTGQSGFGAENKAVGVRDVERSTTATITTTATTTATTTTTTTTARLALWQSSDAVETFFFVCWVGDRLSQHQHMF